jgi:hypothetical protein
MSTISLRTDLDAAAAPSRAAPAALKSGRFVLTVACTSLVHLTLHVAAYALVLRHVYRAFPAGTPEFVQQLVRPAGELVIWAMAVTTLSMGWFITTVIKWSGARSAAEGLKRGVVLGLLFWTAVNSGLYASSHQFSLPSVLADTPVSALCMALASAFAAWMLNASRGHKTS